jgi:ubiquitin carboxyl-terminal hydrolase 30
MIICSLTGPDLVSTNCFKVAEEELSPFCGTLTSRVDKKKDEKSSPTRSTIFNNVTLYLPRRGDILFSPGGKSAVTLETLLQMFVSLETVEDSTKQQTFARLPRCLCFHIQRTGFEAGRAYKRSDGVAFPLHLNMDQFLYVRQLCRKRPLLGQQPDRSQSVGPEAAAAAAADETTSSICNKNSYLLCAVICHLGDMDTGHYVTYRKCYWPSGKVKWYYTSDTDVRPVDLEQVLSANPYILFYERVSPPAALK